MSKARKVLDNWLQKVISANPNDWNYTTDLALSELRGLVMGMKCKHEAKNTDCICVKCGSCLHSECVGTQDDYNQAVEAIANELFGKE